MRGEGEGVRTSCTAYNVTFFNDDVNKRRYPANPHTTRQNFPWPRSFALCSQLRLLQVNLKSASRLWRIDNPDLANPNNQAKTHHQHPIPPVTRTGQGGGCSLQETGGTEDLQDRFPQTGADYSKNLNEAVPRIFLGLNNRA